MVKRPAATVVMPTRGRAHLLATTLRSVLRQRDVDLEAVVVDDGDGPETAALVDRIGDGRIRLIRNRGPRGESGARNRGVAAAQREWVAFCDDDDLWAPGKLAAQLGAAASAGAGWVYAGDVNVNAALQVLSGSPPPDPDEVVRLLPRYNAVPSGSSNVVVRADVLAQAGPFDTELGTCGDWDMWLRLARTAGRPAWVCRPLVAYRFHPMNAAIDARRMVAEPRRLALRHGIHVDIAAIRRRAAWVALRGGRRREAIFHYAHAARHGDVRSLGRAAVALVHPFVGSDAMFSLLRRDLSWIADAEQWLADLAALPIGPGADVAERGTR